MMIRSALLAALFTLALTACSEKSAIEKMFDFDLDFIGDQRTSGPKDWDTATNPETGETFLFKGGKWLRGTKEGDTTTNSATGETFVFEGGKWRPL